MKSRKLVGRRQRKDIFAMPARYWKSKLILKLIFCYHRGKEGSAHALMQSIGNRGNSHMSENQWFLGSEPKLGFSSPPHSLASMEMQHSPPQLPTCSYFTRYLHATLIPTALLQGVCCGLLLCPTTSPATSFFTTTWAFIFYIINPLLPGVWWRSICSSIERYQYFLTL